MRLKLRSLCLAGLLSAGNLYAQTFPVADITVNGDKQNRVNIVLLPDGFQDTQQTTFKNKVKSIQDYVFTVVPFKQYARFFNVYAIEVPSTDTGVTHPGTATDVTEPAYPVTSVNTYFQSSFDNGKVHRSVVAKNSSGVYAVLNTNFPEWDVPMVLVNTTEYGGTGGGYITFTVNSSANETAVHELGHTFGKLWDEYWNNMPGEHPNMTQQSSMTTVKWTNWLTPPVLTGTGIYPYGTTSPESTWFRPHQNCKMRYLGQPLCAVCKENIIDRIYDKVRPIDAYTPDTIAVAQSNPSTPLTFAFTPVLPNPNTFKYQWVLNGNTINTTDTSVQIDQSQLAIGPNTLTAILVDTTLMSRSYSPGKGYVFSIQWKLKREWTTSVTSVNADNKFSYTLYPVPAKNTVNLELNNGTTATTAQYEIATITGSVAKQGTVALKAGEQTLPFDITGIAPGTYTFNLLGDGLILSTKLVVE